MLFQEHLLQLLRLAWTIKLSQYLALSCQLDYWISHFLLGAPLTTDENHSKGVRPPADGETVGAS